MDIFNLQIGSDRKTLKIADVGIAKDEKELTGTMIGTPVYMAPEMFDESETYYTSVDVYSLGLILWELWYGQRVFSECGTIMQLVEKIKKGDRPEQLENCEPILRTLMQDCWQAEPDRRPCASDCIERINAIISYWKSDPRTTVGNFNV